MVEWGLLDGDRALSGGTSTRDMSTWHLRIFKQYGFDHRAQPLTGGKLTCGWVAACSKVQKDLQQAKKPISNKPFRCITSTQDKCLVAEETRLWSKKMGPNRTFVNVPWTCHDTISGYDPEGAQAARNHIIQWLTLYVK